MRFLDLFAGIGGFRLGMTMAGHECVGYVEIDKFARQSYAAIHDTEGEWTASDITTVSDEHIRELGREHGPIHIICGGFPCQAFSIAGKRGGFNDTRGTLFFEVMRFASILGPRYLFLENVEGLLNHNDGTTFETILRTMDEVGYDAEWEVLNTKDYGVPQNRERVFIIGHLRGQRTGKVFPVIGENGKPIEVVGRLDIQGDDYIKRVYSIEGSSPALPTMQGGSQEPKVLVVGNTNPSGNGMNGQVYHSEGLAPTLTTNKGEGNKIIVRPVLTPDREEKRHNGRRFKDPGEPMFTLTAQDKHGVAIIQQNQQRKVFVKEVAGALHASMTNNQAPKVLRSDYRIRKLTPRECWRLQGFPDWAFEKAKTDGVSDSQLYKQAGNSVTVNVIYEIAKRLEV